MFILCKFIYDSEIISVVASNGTVSPFVAPYHHWNRPRKKSAKTYACSSFGNGINWNIAELTKSIKMKKKNVDSMIKVYIIMGCDQF